MKRHKNFNLLLMLVLLVAVGQMAQTIYIPAIADMAVALNAFIVLKEQLMPLRIVDACGIAAGAILLRLA